MLVHVPENLRMFLKTLSSESFVDKVNYLTTSLSSSFCEACPKLESQKVSDFQVDAVCLFPNIFRFLLYPTLTVQTNIDKAKLPI